MDIYKLLYLTTEKCTCFVNTHGTFTKINYALDHNAGLTQFGAYRLHSLISMHLNQKSVAKRQPEKKPMCLQMRKHASKGHTSQGKKTQWNF